MVQRCCDGDDEGMGGEAPGLAAAALALPLPPLLLLLLLLLGVRHAAKQPSRLVTLGRSLAPARTHTARDREQRANSDLKMKQERQKRGMQGVAFKDAAPDLHEGWSAEVEEKAGRGGREGRNGW